MWGAGSKANGSPAAAVVDSHPSPSSGRGREKRRALRQARGRGRASIRLGSTRATLRQAREIKGKKRHILVGTGGLLLQAIAHAADIQDRDGGALLLATLFGLFPFLKKPFAGSACQGPLFHKAVGKILTQLDIEIVKRSGQAKGFAVPPTRWIAERTIAWLNRCRRLAKDWENPNVKALAFLRFASIRLMPRKLCNPS